MPDSATMNSATSDRLVSLDVFRGITIAGMVLVNNPGTWSNIYWPLEHAEWNGWTPTDLIFPFFVFIVGVAIPLAFGRRIESGGSKRDLYGKIVRRTLIIFALGMFLASLSRWDTNSPYLHLSTIRIPGVLQRLAVCYLFASIIFLNTKVRTQVIIAAALLVIYWLMMTRLHAPGFATGDLSKEGSVASWVDRAVFGPDRSPRSSPDRCHAIVRDGARPAKLVIRLLCRALQRAALASWARREE